MAGVTSDDVSCADSHRAPLNVRRMARPTSCALRGLSYRGSEISARILCHC